VVAIFDYRFSRVSKNSSEIVYDDVTMSDLPRTLSSNSIVVLEMIAAGCSFERIEGVE
jgi:hypothetical protein